jgi:hypothetical protein
MSLQTQLLDYIRAAFSGLYLETLEPAEALRELAALCQSGTGLVARHLGSRNRPAVRQRQRPHRDRSTDGGAQPAESRHPRRDHAAGAGPFPSLPEQPRDRAGPLAAAATRQDDPHVRGAPRPDRQPAAGTRTVVRGPHARPATARTTRPDRPRTRPRCLAHSQADEAAVLDAAAGLTRSEAEGAFALSLIRHDALQPEAVWELKAQALKRQALLTLTRTGETFAQLGGLTALKDFCRRALQPGRSVRPRGALLLSPPGCGKSAFCRALGQEVGRPVLTLDLGALYGSLVGETERNVRRALACVDALAPAILFVDELDKGLAGNRW